MRRLLLTLLATAWLLAFAPSALGGIAEIRDAQGHLVATAPTGSYASLQDGGFTLRFDSSSRSARGVSLSGVSLAGGLVYAERIFVPTHGLAGAVVRGLTVNGKTVPSTPNTLVPLGPASYLVVLQEAVVPGEGSGVVGLRLVAGDSSLGIDPGSQLLVGLARAALPPARHHRTAQLSWLALGVTGHGADTGSDDLAFPESQLLGVPATGGSIGGQAVQIAMQYLGIPYLWGGADPVTGFDCSGLTMYVYAQLGIHLTHYTGSQFYEGARVPPWALQPGDLVFFEPSSRGPQHEGMYIGGGKFIQAPHTGDVVKISSLSQPSYAFGFVGAVRPFGA
ncbi:MAG: peptidoglycan DL-endopeptidase CwlO [Gaiellaceae bacterium]|nr:peptidoglycan DL-endopeptidase CwlO [Gaiellaceae bacterium]